MVWNYQNADCSLRIIVSFIIIFGTLSSPMPSRRTKTPTRRLLKSPTVKSTCHVQRQLAEWVIWHRLPQFRIRRFDVAVGDCTSLTRTWSVGEEVNTRRRHWVFVYPIIITAIWIYLSETWSAANMHRLALSPRRVTRSLICISRALRTEVKACV